MPSNSTDILKKLNGESGATSGPIQYPLNLSSGIDVNKYIIHFRILPATVGRTAGSKIQKVSNPQEDDPKTIKSSSDSNKQYTTTKSKASGKKDIYLYMPENITESYAHDWENSELGSIKRLMDVGSTAIAGNFKEAATQSGEQLVKLVTGGAEAVTALNVDSIRERNTGVILNPNVELLYKNTQLKSHSFQFKFMPKNQRESIAVKKIIELFKYHSAPSHGGALLHYPDVFQIEFMYADTSSNQQSTGRSWLYAIHPSALVNIEVNYTGAGQFASFKDGAPVHTEITLQFQELTIQTKQKIKKDALPEVMEVL